MAATFDPTLPTNRDFARQELGDTDVSPAANAYLSDEQYDAMLAAYSYSLAVGKMADAILALLSARPTRYAEHNGISVDWDNLLDHLKDVSKRGRAGLIDEPGTVADDRVHSTHAVNKLNWPINR
jgi:hypothetical protein